MKAQGERVLLQILIIGVIVGLSTVLGNYAAMQMADQTLVKNAMLCQILFLAGLLAGSFLVMGYQAWEGNRTSQSGADKQRKPVQ